MALEHHFREKSINDFLGWFRNNELNLSPGFQRQSVWAMADRKRLIQSIANGYPLPTVFLYERRGRRGKIMYDVIDGKQRLESILMFMGVRHFSGESFPVQLDLGDGTELWTWREICRLDSDLQHRMKTFTIGTVLVTGDPSEIIDLFVRINSTGKSLTAQERRHAQYYESPILKNAHYLIDEFRPYLLQQKILTAAQLDRMKGVELMLELLLSIHCGGVINRKSALDRIMAGEERGSGSLDQRSIARLVRQVEKTFRCTKQVVPDLRPLRMHNSAEFYSLFMVLWEMLDQDYVLSDPGRNAIARRLLAELSVGVDELRERLRTVKPGHSPQALFRDYYVTVQSQTDSADNRQRRAAILRSLLAPLFQRKDSKRVFSPEQRRLLWNSEAERTCSSCGTRLSWETFAADHVKAWSKGGPTELENAQLLCTSCNSVKGNK